MRRRVILSGLLVAAVAALLLLAPWRAWLAGLSGWARDAGPDGVAAFALAYVAGSVLALPVWPLTVAAGVAYGAWGGFALALPAGAAGASLAFLAGRTLFRGAVARRVARDPRLAALDEAVVAAGRVPGRAPAPLAVRAVQRGELRAVGEPVGGLVAFAGRVDRGHGAHHLRVGLGGRHVREPGGRGGPAAGRAGGAGSAVGGAPGDGRRGRAARADGASPQRITPTAPSAK